VSAIPSRVTVQWVAVDIATLIKSLPTTLLALLELGMAAFCHRLERTVPELDHVTSVGLFVVNCIGWYLLTIAMWALTVRVTT